MDTSQATNQATKPSYDDKSIHQARLDSEKDLGHHTTADSGQISESTQQDWHNDEILWEYKRGKIGFVFTILQIIIFGVCLACYMLSFCIKKYIAAPSMDIGFFLGFLLFAWLFVRSFCLIFKLLNQKAMYVKGEFLYLVRHIGATSAIPLRLLYVAEEVGVMFGVLWRGGSTLLFFDSLDVDKHPQYSHYFYLINPRVIIRTLGSDNLDKLYEILRHEDIEMHLLNADDKDYRLWKVKLKTNVCPKIEFDKIDKLREERNA